MKRNEGSGKVRGEMGQTKPLRWIFAALIARFAIDLCGYFRKKDRSLERRDKKS